MTRINNDCELLQKEFPEFKVGDKVRYINDDVATTYATITRISELNIHFKNDRDNSDGWVSIEDNKKQNIITHI